MAIVLKQLAIGSIGYYGTLPTAAVDTGKVQVVKSIRVVNISDSALAYVHYHVRHSGSDFIVSGYNFTLAPGQAYVDDSELVLEAGDYLQIDNGATTVHAIISGYERDQE